MVLMMARPWKHPDTGIYWFRKRVPDALRALVGKVEERFSLKTREPEEAKRLHALAAIEVAERWANLAKPERSISEREALEVARSSYDWLRARYVDNPSEQTIWDTSQYEQLFAPLPPYVPGSTLAEFLSAGPVPLQQRAAMIQLIEQRSSETLGRWGVRLDDIGQQRLKHAVGLALQAAALDLKQSAQFQSTTTRPVGTVSLISDPPKEASVVVPFSDLIDGWALEKQPVEKTRYTFELVFQQLAEHVGHTDAARLTVDDILGWKEALLKKGLSPRTIRFSKLAGINAVLQWAADNRKLSSNVAEKVDIVAKPKPGQGRRGYTDDEAKKILEAASKEKVTYLRWLPWLSAYTGARISELCQLRREDILQIGEHWVLRITAEAGSVKNVHSERTVPIHRRLEREGFLKFADTVKAGPLFQSLTPDRFGNRGGNGTKLVGRWVRGLGIDDPRISPSHSWRHRLKTLARRHGLAGDVVDAITGHERESVADQYGEYEIRALSRELAKLP